MSERTGRNPLLRFPKTVIAAFVLLTIVGAWFARYFEIDASADTLLVKDNRLYLESRQASQRFSPDEFVLVAYRPASGDIFSPETLQTVAELSRRFGAMERVRTVTNIRNVPLLSQMEELSTGINPADWTLENREFSRERLREIFTDHPIYSEQLVTADLSATAMQVVFEEDEQLQALDRDILALQRQALDEPLDDEASTRMERLESEAAAIEARLSQQRREEIDSIYGIAEEVAGDGEIYLGGNYVLVYHLVDIIQNDLVVFGSAIALIVCLLLFALFRDFRWVAVPLLCCLCSVVVTLGLFGFLGLKTTVISSNFVALQLILTLALVIHLIVQYQVLATEEEHLSHPELLQRTLRLKITPVFFAGLTTSVGFASLLFSNIQPVISFGWMMIVAMLTSIVVSLVLFPAFLALSHRKLPHGAHGFSLRIVEFFRRRGERNPGTIVLASVVLLALSVAGLWRLDVENSFINYFRDSTRIKQELTFIDQELGGSTPLDIIYEARSEPSDPELVVSAADVQMLQKIQASLETSRAVGKMMSVVNFTELARQVNNGEPLTEYELNSLYLLLDEDLRQRLVGSYMHEESGQFRLSARIADTTEGLRRAEFLASVRRVIEEIGVSPEQYQLTNLFVLYQDILQRLFDSQILTLGLVYAALGLVLLAIFRSFRIALVALLPNILATLAVLGAMGWFGIPLDLMTITIAAITMGIAVDDTIHFVHHYLRALREGADPASAVRHTFHSVGYALLFTSLIIALGFSVLGFSDFVPSVLFGLLTCLAMLLAFVIGLTLLPVLLKWAGRSRGGKAAKG